MYKRWKYMNLESPMIYVQMFKEMRIMRFWIEYTDV